MAHNQLYWFIYLLLTSAINITLCFLTNYIATKFELERFIDKAYLWVLTVFLSFLILFFYLNIIVMNQVGLSLESSRLGLLLIGGNTVIILSILFITMRATIRVTQNEQLNEYTEQLEQQYTAIRKMRHDYLNILTSMIGYINDNDLQGLEEYIVNEILPVEKKIELGEKQFKNLKNLKIPPLKALLFAKMNVAQILGIKITAEIPSEITKLNVKYFTLSRMLGIILDNAIEESEQCENPEINIGIFKENSSKVIIIENKCRFDTLPLQQLKKVGFSTKGEKRGLGLSILDELTSKHKNVFLKSTIENSVFIQEIKILD